jgi:hypothetical protein
MTVNMFPANQVPTCTTNSCNEPNTAADFQSVWRQQPAPIASHYEKFANAPTSLVALPLPSAQQPIASFYEKFANAPTNLVSPSSQSAKVPIRDTWLDKFDNAPKASAPNNFVAEPGSYQPPTAPDKTAYPSFETADRPDADPYANYGGSSYGADAATCAGPQGSCGGYDAATVDYSVSDSYGVSPKLAETLDLENLKTTADAFDLMKTLENDGKLTREITETLGNHIDQLISDSRTKFDPNMDYLPTGYDGISVEMMADMGEDISIYTRPPKEMTDGLETPDDITALMLKLQAEGKLTAELTNQLLNLKYSDEFTSQVDPNPLSEDQNLKILKQLKSSFGGVPSTSASSIGSMIEQFSEKFAEPGEAAGAVLDLAKTYAELPRAESKEFFASPTLQTYFEYAVIKMAALAEKLTQAGKLTRENVSGIVDAAAKAKSMFGAEPNPEAMDRQLSKLELRIAQLTGSGMQSVLMD